MKDIFGWGWFDIYIYLVKIMIEIEIEQKNSLKCLVKNAFQIDIVKWFQKIYINIDDF